MTVTLRIVRGILKDHRGNSAGDEVRVRSRRFAIGRALDCHVRCGGSRVESHHCLILIEADRVVLRDLNTVDGTYLNGARIRGSACLFDGDRLRVGKLEFEVSMTSERRTLAPARPAPREMIVPLRDTVPERVAKRLESTRLNPNRRLMPRSRESVFPRQF